MDGQTMKTLAAVISLVLAPNAVGGGRCTLRIERLTFALHKR
jgi:hypothetical protein